MCALHHVITQRSQLVSTLASGSVETYENVLDHLLAWDVLNWEEYENVSTVGLPLSRLARDLLDIIACKGEEGCRLFIDALQEAEKVPHMVGQCPQAPKDILQLSQHLQSTRTHIVRLIHNHMESVFKHLLEQGCVTKYEVDVIQLPIYSPLQKARRLLDLLRGKGNESAKFLIQFIDSLEKGPAPIQDDFKEPGQGSSGEDSFSVCLGYQKKLKSTISAQSRFLSTYDGAENVCLADVYTESVLELSKSSSMSHHTQGSQNPLEVHDILNAKGLINENADMILILGNAGSGKSTLFQQIHQLWAGGKAFQNFCLIFPFSCRRLCCVGKQVSLKTLLFEHCCWPDRHQEEIFQFLLDNPSQILLTFDGFDEFKFPFTEDDKHCCPTDPTSTESIVFNLLQGNLMKGSIKLVASRPDAVTTVLRKYVQKEVSLKGFSEEGIELFMRKHHRDPETAREIISLVNANSPLHGLCHIPVFCWIVSKCHKELILTGCSSLQTMTDMYFLTLQHFLLHGAMKKKLTGNILEKRVNSISHLGKLAFNGLCCGCYAFSDQQIVDAEVNEEDISLGFLVLSKNLSIDINFSTQHYEFLHITFQCFFAALYIAMSDGMGLSSLHHLFNWTRKQPSMSLAQRLPQLCVQPCVQVEGRTETKMQKVELQNLQITANFVAGLFSQRLYDLLVESWQLEKLPKKLVTVRRCLIKAIHKHFKSIPPAVQGEKKSMHAMPTFLWLIKCIYETQDSSLAKQALKGLEVDHLKLTYCGIGPAECTALAFVLKHLKNPVGIQLDYNSVGDIGIEQLFPCLHMCQALYLRDNNISDKGACKLMDQAVHWPNFQKIALFNNNLTDKSMDSFANLLKHKQNFLALRLGNNLITAAGGEILAEGLKESKSITFLGLWGNSIGDVGAQAVAEALQDNRSLIWLSLVGNNIGSSGARALAAMLEKNTILEELCLEENQLGDEDAMSFAEALKKNATLKTLKLSNNRLGERGVSALAQALCHNSTVAAIWLRGNNLTSEETQKLSQMDCRLSLN